MPADPDNNAMDGAFSKLKSSVTDLKSFRQIKYLVAFGTISVYLTVWVATMFDIALLALRNLTVFLPPTREYLLQFSASKGGSAALAKSKARSAKKEKKVSEGGPLKEPAFTIPNDSKIELDTGLIDDDAYNNSNRRSEWHLLVHTLFGLLGTTVIVELLGLVWPTHEGLTLAFMWAVGGMFMSLCIMIQSVLDFIIGSVTHERVITICVLVSACLVALSILLVSENYFDFGLDHGYAAFTAAINATCSKAKITNCDIIIPTFKSMKLLLAVFSGFVSVALLFPTMRFARSQISTASHFEDNAFVSVLLHLNTILPVLYIISFIPFLSRSWIHHKPIEYVGCQYSSNTSCISVNFDNFDRMRLGLLFLICGARVVSLKFHLQSFLMTPKDQLLAFAKGKKCRLHYKQIQILVGRVSRQCVATALQLLGPPAFVVSCAIVLLVRGFHFEPTSGKGDMFSSLDQTFYRPLFHFVCWWTMSTHVVTTLIFGAYLKYEYLLS